MYDILYVGHDEEDYNAYAEYEQLKEQFGKRFPTAEIKDGSDDIHGWRFTVEMPDTEKREYIKYVIREGLHELSFIMQFMMRTKEGAAELTGIVDELKAEKAERT